jgi:hypothetical protein
VFKKKKVAEFVECMRYQRCDVLGCDVQEWHRHEVIERVLGDAELLEELPPPTEPDPQPPPPPPEFED